MSELIGRPIFWHLSEHISAVEGMIRADELQLALEMCGRMLPAYYREPENYPSELRRIRDTIYRQLYDASTYGCDPDEAGMSKETALEQTRNGYMYPRFDITLQRLKELNAEGAEPWVYELGVSHGNLVAGLMDASVKFKYLGRGINWRIVDKVSKWAAPVWQDRPAPGQRAIFVCFESLEHMLNEQDLEAGAKKVGVEFDEMLLSVPYGCLGGGLENWDTRPLGHVRGYSKHDFTSLAERFFPGYKWTLFMSHSMVLHGRKA